MSTLINSFLLFLFVSGASVLYAQTNQEKASLLKQEAITYINEGKPEKSIKLLEEAIKLDPGKYDYSYELAYAYFLQNEYHRAIEELIKLTDHKDITDDYFQLLGNSYNNTGNKEKAIAVYEEGLKKFPDSGNLYMELGNVQFNKKDYSKALHYFEKGIEVEPDYSTLYYWAAKMYCSSGDKVWGMIYGEIFINMEPSSKRTIEISKLLFDTYKGSILLPKDNDASVSLQFCKEEPVQVNAKSDSTKYKMPYCMVYQPTCFMSVVSEKEIDLASLNRIRIAFVEHYFDKRFNIYYPNILFEYQDKLLQAGHLEAYNYWVLKDGNNESFAKWKSKNKDKWDSFEKWFASNRLLVDGAHRFYKGQY
jgi:tetratricopeptide (TPR) repeat protein